MGGYIGATAVGLTTTAADVQGDITSTDTTPELILKNTSEEDTEGGREGKITFKGEQSGGEESTLAQIESAHDGTADDQKGDLIFKTNDGSDGASPTEAMRIDSSGNVAIGFNNPDAYVTDANSLVIKGQLRAQGVTNTAAAPVIGVRDDNTGFYLPATNTLGITTDSTERMRIDSSGKVGIGTTSPSANLHVAQDGNNVALYAGGGGYNFQAKFESSDAEAAIIIEDSNSTNDGNRIGVVTNDMTFITDNSERMRINSDGQLLVGATTAASTNISSVFAANNSATSVASGNGAAISIQNTNTTDNNYSTIYFQNSAGATDSAIYGVHEDADGTGTSRSGELVFATANTGGGVSERMRIGSDGSFKVLTMPVGGTANLHYSSGGGGQFFVTSSSKRFKHDIVDYDKGLAEVLQMQPKYFVYNEEPNEKQRAGFIAEDFHDIGMTEYVEYWQDENGEDIPSEIGYSNMVAVLVKAIQELSAKNDALETKVETLETQNTTQATQIADLITRVEALEGA